MSDWDGSQSKRVLELLEMQVDLLKQIQETLKDNSLIIPECKVDDGYDEVAGLDITRIPTDEEALECIDAEFGDYAPRAKVEEYPDILNLGWWMAYNKDRCHWELFRKGDGQSLIVCSDEDRLVHLWVKAQELRGQRDMMLRRWQEAEGRLAAQEKCDCGCTG